MGISAINALEVHFDSVWNEETKESFTKKEIMFKTLGCPKNEFHKIEHNYQLFKNML